MKLLKTNLKKHFKMKDLKSVKKCLGMRIRENDNVITVDQEEYIDKLLKTFNMTDCRTISTPMEMKQKLTIPSDDEVKIARDKPYQKLIGCLMYLAVGTRPDICYSVSYLSQFNTKYGEAHWNAAKRVLRYLKTTKNYCLTFKKGEDISLRGYVDADWGGDIQDRKSYTGYVFTIGGSIVSWEARKQRCVALSSTEAEYIALSEASKEAIHLRRLLVEFVPQTGPVLLLNDNQGAQKLVVSPVFHRRTKHIDIRYHFVRNAFEENLIKVEYLSTQEMVADIMTKELGSEKHRRCVERLGLKKQQDLKIQD